MYKWGLRAVKVVRRNGKWVVVKENAQSSYNTAGKLGTDDNKIQKSTTDAKEKAENSITDAGKIQTSFAKGSAKSAKSADYLTQMQKMAEIAEIAEPFANNEQKNAQSVVDKNEKIKPQTKEINSISEGHVKCVEVKDGKVVDVCYEVVGYTKRLEGGKVVEVPSLNIIFRYKDKEFKCVGDKCEEVISEVAKLTDYHPPKHALLDAIEGIKKSLTKETPVCEYVMTHYPDLYREAERNIIGFMLRNSDKFVHGYEKPRELVAYSAFSAFLDPSYGTSRLSLMLIGGSGAGKSTIVKSILYQFPDDMVAVFTRVTTNFLGYSTDLNKPIVFFEQIDGQNINYAREYMSEDRIVTGTVEKNEDGKLTARTITIKHRPVFITTSVVDITDAVKAQIENRLFKVYINSRGIDLGKVVEKMANRGELEYPFEVKAVIACFIRKMPKDVKLSQDVINEITAFGNQVLGHAKDFGVVVRAISRLMVLVRIHAGLKLKSVADISDFNDVMAKFRKEVLFDALGLSERDIEFLQYVRDAQARVSGEPKTDDIVAIAKVHKQYVISVLKNLERKGLVYSEKPDNAFRWGLTDLGKEILEYVEGVIKPDVKVEGDLIKVKTQDGEVIADKDFFRGSDGRGDKKNAVSDDKGRMRKSDGKADRGVESVQVRPPVLSRMIHRLRIKGEELDRFAELYSEFSPTRG